MSRMDSTMPNRKAITKGILFCAGFLGYLVPTILPLMMHDISADLQISLASAGMLASMQAVTAAIAVLAFGPICDRYGSRNVLNFSLLLNGIALCLLAQARTLGELYMAGVFSSVMFSSLVLCAMTYIGNHCDIEDRSTLIGMVSGTLYAAVAVGIPISVALMEQTIFGWRAVFMTFGLFSLLVGAISTGSLIGPSFRRTSRRLTVRDVILTYLRFARNTRLFGLLMIFFIIRLGVGMYFTYGAAYMLLSRNFPADGFSIIYPAGAAFALMASFYVGKIKLRTGAKPILVAASMSIISAILLIVIYPTTPQNIVPVMAALSTLYMVSESFRMATLNAEAVSLVEPVSQGAFLGAVNCLVHAGTALGAFIGGWMLNMTNAGAGKAQQIQVGFTNMVYLTALLWAAAAILAVFMIGKKTDEPSSILTGVGSR